MKKVKKHARKLRTTLTKLAIKAGKRIVLMDGKKVKGETDGDETRRKLLSGLTINIALGLLAAYLFVSMPLKQPSRASLP